MYEPTQNPFSQLAFLWPALAAASASEAAAQISRQFAEFAGGGASEPAAEPDWTTPADWADLRAEAADAHNDNTADYLLGTPNVGDLLEEGLTMLGYSCEEIEMGRL